LLETTSQECDFGIIARVYVIHRAWKIIQKIFNLKIYKKLQLYFGKESGICTD